MVTETFQPEGFFSKEVASFEKKCFFLCFFLSLAVPKIYFHLVQFLSLNHSKSVKRVNHSN
jgi:heme/copper-type cytochrome/quinol oxidase subunit 4